MQHALSKSPFRVQPTSKYCPIAVLTRVHLLFGIWDAFVLDRAVVELVVAVRGTPVLFVVVVIVPVDVTQVELIEMAAVSHVGTVVKLGEA